PLMDNDAAHHANIALRMYLTGDYVHLVDKGEPYLDKPHLHFWLCAISFKIFGVNSFAYRLPSFLFTIGGVYSVYQLGKLLYDEATGKLAALVIASSFGFALSNSDVRMDAILTSAIAFATWQLLAYIQYRRLLYIAGAAFGLALGFSTKGMIGVFVPLLFLFFYIVCRKEPRLFILKGWLLLILLFVAFISPILYCYYQQFNLHPELVVRGQDHINGIRFALLGQSTERFGGGMSADSRKDYLFFFYTFIWVFGPWSLIAYPAWIKIFFKRRIEWVTSCTILVLALVIGFAGSKLPHYLNISFPVAAILVASHVLIYRDNIKWQRYFRFYRLASVIALVVL
ncbi:MAG TPA: glycosyltransferase family 39 protein, partial [Allocoleopsis sp.]